MARRQGPPGGAAAKPTDAPPGSSPPLYLLYKIQKPTRRSPMTDQPDPRYAERMFPAPVDHGIAQPDRAVSSVRSGTDTAATGDYKNALWYQGSGRIGERPVESIVIYPPTRGVTTQGDPFEPVKIGVLIDMDLGQLTADLMDPIILAVEDALNEGVYDRPVEIVTVDARALPRENYRKVHPGYTRLVEDGCVVVIGPFI